MGMYCQVSVASSGDLGRLSEEPDILGGLLHRGTATADSVLLEKAWHGLHYLLTGETWEGHGPLAFLLAGGEQLGDDDESPLRWFAPDEAKQIHQALSGERLRTPICRRGVGISIGNVQSTRPRTSAHADASTWSFSMICAASAQTSSSLLRLRIKVATS